MTLNDWNTLFFQQLRKGRGMMSRLTLRFTKSNLAVQQPNKAK